MSRPACRASTRHEIPSPEIAPNDGCLPRRETSDGAFERALPIPSGARTEDVKATYSDGILEVVVPGAAKRSTQRVPVEVGSEKKKK